MRGRSPQILVLASRFPFPPRSGAQTRVYHLVRQLAKQHEVTLLTYASDDDLGHVEDAFADVRVEVVRRRPPSRARKRRDQLLSLASRRSYAARTRHSRELQAAIDRLSAQTQFDAVQLESALLCTFRFPAGVPLVLDEHNIEYEVLERMRAIERSPVRRAFYALEQARVRSLEHAAWRRVAGCVLTSAREQQIVRGVAPGTPTAVVPNAVDPGYFCPSGARVEAHGIVFNGVLDYHPNLDAAAFLVDEVLPLIRERCPGVSLTIVGRGRDVDLERLRRPGVRVMGEVPDIRPWLERAAVEVVPVRTGGGTRLKVLEGLALGNAIVSTTLGCEGIDVRHGEHLLIADAPDAFAAEVVRLLNDPELAQRLGQAGRRLVEAGYSWDSAGERLADLYRVVAGKRRAANVPAAAGGR